MSDNVFGKAETDKTRQEIVSAIVQRAIRERAQLVPTVRDVSSLATPGLDAINFPRRDGKFIVQNLVEDSAADTQSFEYVLDKLELDQHAMISWFLKKRSEVQGVVNFEADLLVEAAAEHAIDVDRKIITALAAGAASANDVSVSGGAAISKIKILEAKEKLQKSTRLNPRNARFTLLINSKREAEMLNIADFVKANEYGNANVIQTGALGRIFGVETLLTDESELGDSLALMYIDQGLVYGNQMAPDYRELYQPKRAGTEYALDQLYGLKVLDGGKYISKIAFT
jgi:hypothetical protein